MSRIRIFSSSLLDTALGRIGLVRRNQIRSILEEREIVRGHVFADLRRGGEVVETIDLGENVLTERMRINIAGLLASPAAPAVYLHDTGYDHTGPYFPVDLELGVGTAGADTTDTALDSPLTNGAAALLFTLRDIDFRQNVAGYGTDPIHVAWVFNVPAGQMFDDPSGGPMTPDVTIQEFGLKDGAGNLLARRVAEVTKLSDLDLDVRWEWRT